MSQHNAADIKSRETERVDKTQHVRFIGYAEVAAYFVVFDVAGADDHDDFRLLFQLEQHFQLAVRQKARQNTACVVIVEQLAAEFEIQLAAEFFDPLLYAL